MPRRKKALDAEADDAKRTGRKTKRINLSVRVAHPKAALTKEGLEQEYEDVLETSDGLTKRVVDEEAVTPDMVEEIAQEIERLKLERDKKLLMWIGVTFIMAVVLVLWVYNLKFMFREQENRNLSGRQLNIEQISAEFNKTIEEVNDGLSKFSDISTTTLGLAEETATTTATSGGTGQALITGPNIEDTEEIKQLRARLEELERRFNLSTTTVKTTN